MRASPGENPQDGLTVLARTDTPEDVEYIRYGLGLR
jgi:hypothetical protein